jgi:hypothetical protein
MVDITRPRGAQDAPYPAGAPLPVILVTNAIVCGGWVFIAWCIERAAHVPAWWTLAGLWFVSEVRIDRLRARLAAPSNNPNPGEGK